MATTYWVVEDSTDTEISGGFVTFMEAQVAADSHYSRTGNPAHVEIENI